MQYEKTRARRVDDYRSTVGASLTREKGRDSEIAPTEHAPQKDLFRPGFAIELLFQPLDRSSLILFHLVD